MSVISLSLAKEALGIGHSARDNVLALQIAQCEAWLEKYLSVKFSAASRTEDLDGGGYRLWPKNLPLNSVSSVKDVFSDLETCYFIAQGNMVFRADSSGSRINYRWEDGQKRYRIVYNGGYSTVPDELKGAILSLLVRAYNNQRGVSSESQFGLSVNWGNLMTSDIAKMFQAFRLGRPIF